MTSTTDQTAPYGGHPPHARGSETSAEAAESVAGKAELQRQRVLAVLRAAGVDGLTDHEIAAALRIPLHSAVPRRRSLVIKELVRDSGRERLSPYRKRVTIWVATNKREQLELP